MSFIPQQSCEVMKPENQLPETMEQEKMQHQIVNNSLCELRHMKIGELPSPSTLTRNKTLGRPRKHNPYYRNIVAASYISGPNLLQPNYIAKDIREMWKSIKVNNVSTVEGNKIFTFHNTFSGKYEMDSGTRKNVHSVTKSFQHLPQFFQSFYSSQPFQQPSLHQLSSLQPFQQQPSLPYQVYYQPLLFSNTVNSELPQQSINK
ncbi:hypothetical protein RhiirA5_417176 [Rhizophagus irregularis]|uniref:Uncharacterized protein n=3 Tax=Rhizophagus irregularis TaxID=588596 RepID=U9SWV4_RHIID|nr:hypothetical protein GLOIN_2v1769180 [Rhizophagus irregularis DAOM 181602=DAOM 197198]EXX70279.1 hypothetical protein RirG_088900 [Rhizophagus irregularis DAOM 197198w]PKC08245.1 hypothetical protein RhiirA5_417176 [Rhizophagus irregularis]PKC63774.1 hypothetical protein RhiirA1_396567 [Rhizophagus irregularis]PKY15702.1 hypothetical protein RhiirB3_381151 [Rhizophagus irregularis]POG76369.1 hypothetical protein GLOIN_2v1769180 [Rhizophagus irregularis DAOM 181602=DAOM 197198]|eukprot:XP_025183235.1 hypothetical protein GLOIN_2v1769180 [Rhizophagus irregularis DAOM 181602=DAOM 197198]